MYLTRSAEYALRLVLELASRGPGARITSAELACSEKIPPAYAEKVVQRLSRAGVVKTRTGPRGGTYLALPPEEVSLAAVVRAAGGTLALSECTATPPRCRFHDTCRAARLWQRAEEMLHRFLEQTTLADLLASKEGAARGEKAADGQKREEAGPADGPETSSARTPSREQPRGQQVR